ncbi:hypothetical protein SAMN05216236_104240 [Sedimentitalea nanhaiensis]|uniref:Uncharacterized protein n=1 Tax=Sedimentitalea nanhaiensis TaxID=999627 RepID=A0A1I6ZPR0_9RHOB|nr:hypothetical protein SAMN05216236_104240 [Sedimentitalea nanhaiensis]
MRALVCYALSILIIFTAVNRVEAGDADFMMDARTGQILT